MDLTPAAARTGAGSDGASGLENLDPETPVGQAGDGHQQTVEIARNLVGSFRVLILDEPTAMLTAHEASLLFQRIEQLKQQGVALVIFPTGSRNWPALRNVSRSWGWPAGANG